VSAAEFLSPVQSASSRSGGGYQFKITIQGQVSGASATTASYLSPVINNFNGAGPIPTLGQGTILIVGSNCEPAVLACLLC
jgi:hypothetical protein